MQTNNDDRILQREREALDQWVGGETGDGEYYGDTVSYFDPLTRARIDGLQALNQYCESSQGKSEISRYEMVNPQVVRSGALALLTYNLTTYARDANDEEILGDEWNCTQVYSQEGKQWKVIHSHWSYTAHDAFLEPPVEGEAGA